MKKIPLHNIHAGATCGILVKHFRHGKITQNGHLAGSVDYAHRDNYYIFILQEKGKNRLLIDFKECKLSGAAVLCILPGQVHIGVERKGGVGWLLAIDPVFVKDNCKEIFEKLLFSGNTIALDEASLADLLSCIMLLDKKIGADSSQSVSYVVSFLAMSFVSLVAEQFQNLQPVMSGKRTAAITRQFKMLLAENFKNKKKPSQYAALLNISPPYLNEAVKTTTGFTASYWIQYEIALEAKRLLFYTDMHIKEISFNLGYEDYSYFTRIFTKITGMPPVQFRKIYRK